MSMMPPHVPLRGWREMIKREREDRGERDATLLALGRSMLYHFTCKKSPNINKSNVDDPK